MSDHSRRIIIFSPTLPKPDQNAGDRRLIALLRMMSAEHRVDFCADQDRPHELKTLADAERYKVILRDAGVHLLPTGATGVARTLTSPIYDVGFFEFHYMMRRYGRLFRSFSPAAKTIVDSVDVHFMRDASAAAVDGAEVDPSQKLQHRQQKDDEMRVYRAADAVVAVTPEDAQAIEQQGGVRHLAVVPLVMEAAPRTLTRRRPTVLFVGGFKHTPNVDGICWFVEQVWPAVRLAVPEANLRIVGSNPTEPIQALGQVPGVEVVGFVPETLPYLDEAAVSVAPLRFGAGMKGKVMEAMASGVPVVTTDFGAQGLRSVSGQHLMIANDAAGFARAVTELLQNPDRAESIGAAGRDLVMSTCSPQAVGASLRALLEQVAPAAERAKRHSFPAWLKSRPLGAALAMRNVSWLRDAVRGSGLHTR